MCTRGHTHICVQAHLEAKDVARFSAVIGSCSPPTVGIGEQTQVL